MEKTGKGRLLFLLLALALPLLTGGLLSGRTLPADGLAAVERPVVALTFDDGPRRSTTEKLLEGLAQRGVHATFFMVGEMLEGNGDLVERMAADGHQMGVHTYDHVWLTELSAADFERQVGRTRELLTQMAGEGSYWLRPPYGGVDRGVEKRAGTPIILWSVDPEDWDDKNVARIVEHITANVRDGDIILLHDIYPTSVEAALQVVDKLQARGFLFATVEELAQLRHVEVKNGEIYRCFYP